jgi:serine/threonine protein kinase
VPGSTATAEPIDFLGPPQEPGELGRLGAYRVLKVLGVGGMGIVFHAEDVQLRRPVALKCLLPALAATAPARQRFLREARAAAAIEHEHIVVLYQVGEHRGIPFLAMQLLQGESLAERLQREPLLPVSEVLRIGREIAVGLAAAHDKGLIHRDIKPGNVWLEGPRARVKLLDFGLARAAADDTGVSQAGTVVGTPAYMAPEQGRGEPVDARCDLFSLGCVLYQMGTGQPPFQGNHTVALLLAVAQTEPSPPCQVNPDLPAPLSDLVMRLLAKEPAGRPASARAVVEVLAALERQPLAHTGRAPPADTSPGPRPTLFTGAGSSGKTEIAGPASVAVAAPPASPSRRWRLPILVAAALVLLVGAALLPGLFDRRRSKDSASPLQVEVEIGIAYGTEKKNWLSFAARQFNESPEGKRVKIKLQPFGSLEGARAIWKDEDHGIHVWAPASSLFRDTLVRRWQKKHGGNPILKEETLALTPLAFILWEDRYRAFLKKYGGVSFTTIDRAMRDEDGSGAFRFSHTDPASSNSGLMTLVLMACEYHKTRRLTVANVTDPGFQRWVKEFETKTQPLSGSTGKLMEELVRRGPSSYEALLVYENLAIDYFPAAQGRWGKLHILYPRYNLWSDHPYYILDVPWSSPQQRQAGEAFLNFLMGKPMQQEALAHGFRPGNVNVPVKDAPDSPFLRYRGAGLQIELGPLVEPPGDEVIENLLSFWGKAGKTK